MSDDEDSQPYVYLDYAFKVDTGPLSSTMAITRNIQTVSTYEDSQSKAEVLNKQFSSVYTKEDESEPEASE